MVSGVVSFVRKTKKRVHSDPVVVEPRPNKMPSLVYVPFGTDDDESGI
jgi:hypothetical protein